MSATKANNMALLFIGLSSAVPAKKAFVRCVQRVLIFSAQSRAK